MDSRIQRNTRAVLAVLVLSVLVMGPTAEGADCPGESSWENESGSILQIEDIDSEGLITGHYTNNASGYNCQGTPYPVTGWVLPGTNTITFTVKWENTTENCASLTSWTGYLDSGCSTITTLWQLVVNGTTSASQILQGSDTFSPIPVTRSSFLREGDGSD